MGGHGWDALTHPPTRTVSSQPQPSSGPDSTVLHDYHGQPSYPWLPLLGDLIKYGVLAYLVVLMWRGARWLIEEYAMRRRRVEHAVPVDFDVLDDPTPLLDELRRDADAQYELLLVGTPRNAIVACWDRFEEQAERVGAARKAWETSSEFTIRLLDAVAADGTAVVRLERLYHEARFSDHEITEDNRRAAVAALQAIHASVGVGAGSRA